MGDAGAEVPAEHPDVLLLVLIVIGMAAGWAAHLLIGNRRRNSWGEDIVVGLLGSLATGLVVSLLAGDGLRLRFTGIIGSIAGAVLVLAIWQAVAPSRKPKPVAHAHQHSGSHSGSHGRSQQARRKNKKR
jgi:uncharacterized membrane protein YeaQ/YmgE (transglycosylase-associated protein family)